MANPSINVLMSLVDKFTSPMNKVNDSVKNTEKQLKHAQNTVANFGKSMNDTFLSLSGWTMAGIGAGFAAAVAGVSSLASQSMELADAQVKAETMLRQALSNVQSIKDGEADALDKAYESLTKYAGALQETGVIGDEVTLMGMKQLATFQLSNETIQTLSKGMLDLAVNAKGLNVTQEDMVNFGNLMGKAMQGNVGALTRYGISMDEAQQAVIKFGTEEERAAMLAQVLQENVGGMNEAMAKTDQGKIQHAMNAYGDMLEEFGRKLIPLRATLYSAFEGFLPQIQSSVMPVLDKLGATFEQLAPKIGTAMGTIVQYIPAVVDVVVSAFTFFIDHVGSVVSTLESLLPVIMGVVAGFTAFNVINGAIALITSVVATIGKLKLILSGCTTVMSVFNAVMLANPIAMVAVGIGALIAVLVLLYKNWDTIIDACVTAWAWFKEQVTANIQAIVDIFGYLIDFVGNVFTGNWSSAWENVVNIFATIFGRIKDIASAPLNWISNKVSSIGSALGFGGGTEEQHNATGTSFFGGGSTYVNEGNRGELINLPSGSQIVPHDLAVKAIGRGGQTININLNVQGNVIGNEDFYNECGEAITQKLSIALANM